MLGFDWTTYRGETYPVDADMLVTGATAVNAPLNENRDRYDLLEGLSGTNFDDLLRGDDRLAADLADDGLTGVPNGHVLNAAGIARIAGLAAILPPGATSWGEGNIILGGAGSDLIEGRGGNDILDGDRWLNVQLQGTLNDATVKLVNTLHDLRNDVFADPQRLNPGNIDIVRSIMPGTPGDDVDTAVFSGNRAEYAITTLPDGTVIVDHGAGIDGRDTLRNIELLAFLDGTIPVPTDAQLIVPNVVNLQQADAEAALTAAGLGFAVEIVENAAPAGTVLGQSPIGGTQVSAGSTVSLQVSEGVELAPTPNLVGDPRADALAEITATGFVAGTITTANSTTIEPGHVISQTPAAGAQAPLEGPINIVVSVGRPGLVLSLNFDEANGLPPLDASASGRNGAITGAVRVPGKVGRAMSFDGVNDWVTVLDGAANTPLDLTNGMTLEAWVNPGTMTGWETVIMKERGANNLSYALYAMDGGASGSTAPAGVVRVNPSDRTVQGTSQLPSGAWSHLATTYDGVTQRLYVNGVQVASRPQTGNMAAGNQALRIGGNGSFAGEFYNGLIDNVRVYNRALSAAEIGAEITAAGGTTPPPPPPPPVNPALPVLSLNFDEASGNAIDSASGLVGTVSGATRVAGVRGNALSFDGVNDVVTVPDAAALDLTTGMTLAAWVNMGARDGWETIILKENVGNYSYALYAQDGGTVQGGSPEPSGNVTLAGRNETLLGQAALGAGTWVHLATTYDGTTQRLFVNGVEVSNNAVTGTIDVGAGALRIGGNSVWAGEYFQGLIDEVRIYNRALTAAEINAVRNP